jgi:hypothetical protein
VTLNPEDAYEVDIPAEMEAGEWLLDNPGEEGNPNGRAGRGDVRHGDVTTSRPLQIDAVSAAQKNPHKVLTALLREELAAIDYTAPVEEDPERAGNVVTIGQSIIRRLVNIILTGRDRDSIEAAKVAFAYMDGLPVQPIEFDISAVVAELAAARGLTAEDTARALDETRRVLNAAKNGSPVNR